MSLNSPATFGKGTKVVSKCTVEQLHQQTKLSSQGEELNDAGSIQFILSWNHVGFWAVPC